MSDMMTKPLPPGKKRDYFCSEIFYFWNENSTDTDPNISGLEGSFCNPKTRSLEEMMDYMGWTDGVVLAWDFLNGEE